MRVINNALLCRSGDSVAVKMEIKKAANQLKVIESS